MNAPRVLLIPWLSLVLLGGVSHAATLCVNPGGTGDCFAAVQAAVDAAANGDTVDIAAGTYVENVVIPEGRVITIHGAGAGVTTIDGGSSSPTLSSPHLRARITLTDLTLANGYGLNIFGGTASISGIEISNSMGTGLTFDRGRLTISNTSINGSAGTGFFLGISAATVSASTIHQSGGLGLWAMNSRLTLEGTTIDDGGGGIYVSRTRLNVTDSTIAGNTGASGITIGEGRALVYGTTVSGNTTAGSAGGILIGDGYLRLTNCTISGNQGQDAGGILVGLYARASLSSVTVVGNTALSSGGGGITNGSTDPRPVNAVNVILANNTGPSPDCAGELVNRGYSLIEDTTGCTLDGPGLGDIYGVDPLLGPLADNGGPTETHALLAGSPAIAAGGSGRTCPDTDQRGHPRTEPCDIGAYQTP